MAESQHGPSRIPLCPKRSQAATRDQDWTHPGTTGLSVEWSASAETGAGRRSVLAAGASAGGPAVGSGSPALKRPFVEGTPATTPGTPPVAGYPVPGPGPHQANAGTPGQVSELEPGDLLDTWAEALGTEREFRHGDHLLRWDERPPRMRGSGVFCRAPRASPAVAQGPTVKGRRARAGARNERRTKPGRGGRSGPLTVGERLLPERGPTAERSEAKRQCRRQPAPLQPPASTNREKRSQPPGRRRVTEPLSAGSGWPVFHLGLGRLAVSAASVPQAYGSVSRRARRVCSHNGGLPR